MKSLSEDPMENIYSVELHGACVSYQVPRFRMRSSMFPNHTTPSLFHGWVCVWMRRGLRFPVAQDTTVRYNTIAKNHAAELEKLLGSPYTINVLEELGRMEIVKMILDRREELRKIQFEEAARVSARALLFFLLDKAGSFAMCKRRCIMVQFVASI